MATKPQNCLGAIVIFAKAPISGSSKTRLSILVGDKGAAELAEAMLSDVLLTISQNEQLRNTMKFLIYAPSNLIGERIMMDILSDLALPFSLPSSSPLRTLQPPHVARTATPTASPSTKAVMKESPRPKHNTKNHTSITKSTTASTSANASASASASSPLSIAPSTSTLTASPCSLLNGLNYNQLLPLDDEDDKTQHGSSQIDYNTWHLLPMLSAPTSTSDEDDTINHQESDLTNSDLGSKLANALVRVRSIMTQELCDSNQGSENVKLSKKAAESKGVVPPIVFLGMDTPEITSQEILYGLQIAQSSYQQQTNNVAQTCPKIMKFASKNSHNTNSTIRLGKAYLSPANDGGYGMLCVPFHAPPSIFQGVRWSSSLTAVSQLKALTDNDVDTVVGSLMNDIDEPEDLMNLSVRLCMKHSSKGTRPSELNDRINKVTEENVDRLSNVSYLCHNFDNFCEQKKFFLCQNTFDALLRLELVRKKHRSAGVRYNIDINKFQVQEL